MKQKEATTLATCTACQFERITNSMPFEHWIEIKGNIKDATVLAIGMI